MKAVRLDTHKMHHALSTKVHSHSIYLVVEGKDYDFLYIFSCGQWDALHIYLWYKAIAR